MNKDVENKVKSILGLYNFYKYQMNTVQRIGMLSLWIEVSIEKEEYEVAASLQKELNRITNGEEEFYMISPSEIINIQREEMERKIKESLEEERPVKVKKKLKFVNYWKTGTLELLRIGFNDFRFVIFNFGLEIK